MIRSENPGRAREIAARLPTDRPLTGVEVGAAFGDTARYLLANLPLLTHHIVDPWSHPDRVRDEWAAICAAQVAEFGARCIIHRVNSVEGPPLVPGLVDFVFIDAVHKYPNCKQDAATWWPKVRPGGFIVFHDYGFGADGGPAFLGVVRAVNEFIGTTARKYTMPVQTADDDTIFVWKPKEAQP